jgi:nitroreductase
VDVVDAIRRRRMVRAYDTRPVAEDVLERVLDAARRAPSAGMSQPVDLLVLTRAEDSERFWDLAFPVREGYPWPHMFDAPVVVVPLVEPAAYARRYAQPDKAAAGLDDLEAWPTPYWWIDGGAAVQNLLLAAFAEGLGALLFGLFVNDAEILRTFGVPDGHRPLGAITIGHPRPEPRVRSSPLPRRTLDEIVHRGHW